MSTAVFPTATDREYFRLRPWTERATRHDVCASPACGNVIDPGEEILVDRRGAVHVDCVIAEALEGGEN